MQLHAALPAFFMPGTDGLLKRGFIMISSTSSTNQIEERSDLFGRSILTATPPPVLDAASIGKIMNDAMPIHKKNSEEISYLYQFYRGNQPAIYRTKEIRPEIKNTVIENRAFEIVEFKKGYEFSHPIIYANIGPDDSAPVDALNRYARLDSKDSKDIELAEWFYISGTSYRLCLPNVTESEDEAPYFTDVLDPRNTFVVYSGEAGRKPLFAGTHVKRKGVDEAGREKEFQIYGVYTEDRYFTWTMDDRDTDFVKAAPTMEANPLGMLPIVEYPLNSSRMGYVELCITLFNAINTIGCNRLDGIEQFVQALLVFINCKLPAEMDNDGKPVKNKYGQVTKVIPKSGDAIDIEGSGTDKADVKYLVSELDQSHVQTAKDNLLEAVYEKCGVPSRKDRAAGGGDTGQAVVLRDGWGAAESRAKSTEKTFKKSETEYLKIVLRICRDTQSSAVEIGNLSLGDIEMQFTRNRNDNMQVKATTLKLLLDSGVNGEDAYETCELFSDPVAVWRKSKAWQDNEAQYIESKMKLARLLGASEPATLDEPPDGGIFAQKTDAEA